jgi:signal transduction histidine kinase
MPKSAKKRGAGNTLHFEPTAYIQRLFGRDLISNEPIAVAELVKNAYDAGTKEVTITLYKDSPQKIIISDYGYGMSLAEFERLWMRPGYSEKVAENPQTKRPFLGEKGIGRFAADKLANTLSVITKKSSEKDALYVSFDWSDFEDRNKNIRDVPIKYQRKSDEELTLGRSGTRLELGELRKYWDLKDWRALRQELKRLLVPSGKVHKFKIIAKVEGADTKGWESGAVQSKFKADEDYKYVFTVNKAGNLNWSLARPKNIADEIKAKAVETGAANINNTFGFTGGHFFYLDNPRVITKQGYKAGVSIYRDGFRVEPYGSEDNDWLEIKYLKASRQGHAPISPSRLFGYIEISREGNPKLRDVTNREGIQESQEFIDFRNFIIKQSRNFADIIERDKGRYETESEAYKAQRAQQERAVRQTTFAEITDQLAHQLRQPLTTIGYDTENLSRWLEKKEISDEFVSATTASIARSVKDINDHITLMRNLSRYGKPTAPIEFDLCALIQEKLESCNRQPEAADVSVQLFGCKQVVVTSYSREALSSVLDNLLQNALNAVKDVKKRSKEINVSVEILNGETYRINIQDNGVGVPEEYKNRLLNENVPSRTGGTGFGLFYCRMVIEENKGIIGFEPLQTGGTNFYVEFKSQELRNE